MLGCAGGPDAEGSAGELRGERMTVLEYERTFETAPTEIGPAREVAARTHTLDRDTAETVDTFIDASEGRTEFPMPREPRAFASDEEFQGFLRRELGSDGLTGSYVLVGTPYWTDADTGIRYVVADPIRAFLGGPSGELRVAGEARCLDDDGNCDRGTRATYLVPEGEFTRPTHVTRNGSNGIIANWHSFFNKTYFPWPWARHGTNAGINLAPFPFTEIGLNCSMLAPYAVPVVSECPFVDVFGQQNAETALWAGLPSGPVFDAIAVCGSGLIRDPDIFIGDQFQLTGNGPSNLAVCGP